MVPAPAQGRIFSIHRRPQLGDCAPSGRVRLDALARWMQDVAFADVEEAGLERVAIWVLRRHRIRVTRFPQFGERCAVDTFCSGIGRMWAERRTSVSLARGRRTDPASRWSRRSRCGSISIRSDGCRARSPSASARSTAPPRVTARSLARLRHPRPEQIEDEWRWRFRRTDADIADHVNNAAYWEPLEDELLGGPAQLMQIDAELEFRTPAQPGPVRILSSGGRRWITDPDTDDVYASTVLMNALTTSGSN